LYGKVCKIENPIEVIQAPPLCRQFSGVSAQAFNRPLQSGAVKKPLDSWPVLFYYFMRTFLRGGDPGESAALFHTFEILKHRRPGSLGKALDSEAGQGKG
jgi:hypothetical protein